MAKEQRRVQYMFPARPGVEEKLHSFPVWPVVGIFIILLSGFIVEAQAFLMPVSLALLLFFVFVPLRRILSHLGVPVGVSAALITAGMLMIFAVLGYLVSGPVSRMIEQAPTISTRLEQRFGELRESLRPIEEAAEKINEIGNDDTEDKVIADDAVKIGPGGTIDKPDEVKVKVDQSEESATGRLLAVGPSVAGQIVFTLVLLFFLLASGDLIYLKIVQSFDTMREKRAAYLALREIESSLGSYLGAITLINACLGVAIGLGMWFWDMPSPILWGVAGFLLNFIPYLGSVFGTIIAALVGLIVFDDLSTPIAVGANLSGADLDRRADDHPLFRVTPIAIEYRRGVHNGRALGMAVVGFGNGRRCAHSCGDEGSL